MVAVPARLRNGVLHFQAPFVAPDQEVEVLVVFAEQPAAADDRPAAPLVTGLVSDRFSWGKSLAATKDLGGKSASQICIEDRENDWR